jgi:hypothetical protein
MISTNGEVNQGLLALPSETKTFLTALFEPADIILFRPIETWTENGLRKQKAKAFHYPSLSEMLGPVQWDIFQHLAERERANQFFGVCPRPHWGSWEGGCWDRSAHIKTVRALWSDIDDRKPQDVLEACRDVDLPAPSLLVSSGNGCHVYWLLEEPYRIPDAFPYPVKKMKVGDKWQDYYEKDGERFFSIPRPSASALYIESILQGIAKAIGGDKTTDLARLLRLPGTMNRKDQRNDRTPVPCVLVDAQPDRRYSLDEFTTFGTKARPAASSEMSGPRPTLPISTPDSVKRESSPEALGRLEDHIAACENAAVGDRSGKDFSLIREAIFLGVNPDELWERVKDVGKFAERTRENYFDPAWQKAEEKYWKQSPWLDRRPGLSFAGAWDEHIKMLFGKDDKKKAPAPGSAPGAPGPVKSGKVKLLRFSDMRKIAEEQEKYIFKTILEQGTLTIFAGLPFAGKTTVLNQLIVSIGMGTDFFGYALEERCPVVFLNADQLREKVIYKRIARALPDEAAALEIEEIFRAQALDCMPQTVTVDFVKEIIHEAKSIMETTTTGVLIIDALRNAFLCEQESGSENDSVTMSKILTPFRKMARETGWAILIPTHSSKGRDQYAGSAAIAGCSDAIWNLIRDEDSDTATLGVITRDGLLPKIMVRQTEAGLVRVNTDALGDKTKENELSAFIAKFPDTAPLAVTAEDVVKAGWAGKAKDRTVRNLIEEANRGGMSPRLERIGGGIKGDPFRYYRA